MYLSNLRGWRLQLSSIVCIIGHRESLLLERHCLAACSVSCWLRDCCTRCPGAQGAYLTRSGPLDPPASCAPGAVTLFAVIWLLRTVLACRLTRCSVILEFNAATLNRRTHLTFLKHALNRTSLQRYVRACLLTQTLQFQFRSTAKYQFRRNKRASRFQWVYGRPGRPKH